MDESQNTAKQLSGAQYWEWRTTISEWNNTKEQLKNGELEVQLMTKTAENIGMRAQILMLTRVQDLRRKVEAAKAEYERFKKQLEDTLGVSLNGKIIDDFTYEIKELPDENTNQ